MGIVAGRGSVRGTVTFTTGLNPDKGVLERVTSVGRLADTDVGSDQIAPVTPGILLRGLDAIAG